MHVLETHYSFQPQRRIISIHMTFRFFGDRSHSIAFNGLRCDNAIRTALARGMRGIIRFEAPLRSRTRRSVRWTSLSCCRARISYDNPSKTPNVAVPVTSAGCCRSAAAAESAESDSRAPAPPDADLPGVFADRPSSGTPCRIGRTETACSRCAYACAWSGCCSGRTPCRTPRTCAVSHL